MIPLKDDNPTQTVPYVNYGIIGLNVFLYLYLVFMGPVQGERFVLHYSVIPAALFGDGQPVKGVAAPGYFSLLSSMFLHGGLLHIAGNMLFLWIFGDNIEDYLGHLKYLLFYLVCGVLAAYSHALLNPDSTLPMLGASGAISGVLGAYLVLFPRNRVHAIFFYQVVSIPAILAIGIWIVFQFVSGIGAIAVTTQTGGVAYAAHVGGFRFELLKAFASVRSTRHGSCLPGRRRGRRPNGNAFDQSSLRLLFLQGPGLSRRLHREVYHEADTLRAWPSAIK